MSLDVACWASTWIQVFTGIRYQQRIFDIWAYQVCPGFTISILFSVAFGSLIIFRVYKTL